MVNILDFNIFDIKHARQVSKTISVKIFTFLVKICTINLSLYKKLKLLSNCNHRRKGEPPIGRLSFPPPLHENDYYFDWLHTQPNLKEIILI